jgi:hypothetical protein
VGFIGVKDHKLSHLVGHVFSFFLEVFVFFFQTLGQSLPVLQSAFVVLALDLDVYLMPEVVRHFRNRTENSVVFQQFREFCN